MKTKRNKKKNHIVFALWSVWGGGCSHTTAAAAAVYANYNSGSIQSQDLAATGGLLESI